MRQLQDEIRRQLSAAGIAASALDARSIIQHVTGLSHEALITEPGRPVSNAELDAVQSCLRRRLDHEPVSRIIGSREFYGRDFIVTPDVLDPRPDTETLIEQVLDIARCTKVQRIADIGTGSGAIIVTLLAELADATGTATDISASALEVARRNAQALGVGERVEFARTSWLENICGPYDVIVSNPPYIESNQIECLAPDVARFDPHQALDGGADGLECYRMLIPQAFARLTTGGYLCLEVGAGQDDAVLEVMTQSGFSAAGAVVSRRCDLGGHIRVVTGRKI